MVNNTVNGEKIGIPAGINDNVKVTYCDFGKKEKERINVGKSGSNPLIKSIRDNGDLSVETSTYVAIKAYPGGNPKAKSPKDEITH